MLTDAFEGVLSIREASDCGRFIMLKTHCYFTQDGKKCSDGDVEVFLVNRPS